MTTNVRTITSLSVADVLQKPKEEPTQAETSQSLRAPNAQERQVNTHT